MIKEIGIDLLETNRIQRALERSGFLQKYYTEREIALGANGRWKKLANNFAVKEAVSKAFGLGFQKFSLREVEVLRNPLGKPYVILHGKAREIARQLHIRKIHVSISDTKEHITAIAITEK